MVATLSQAELKAKVREKDWEVTRGKKPTPPPESPEVKNEKLVNSVVQAINGLKSKVENDAIQSKSLSDNLVQVAKTMTELGKNQADRKTEEPEKVGEKRKWNMNVVRDSDHLIKSIVVEEI